MNILDKIKNYEFDIIELPSRGLFYNIGRSFVFIKFITPKEENILSAPFLSETDLAIDMVIESVLLDDIPVDDLLSVDRKAIIMFLRSKAFQDSFELDVQCSNCSAEFRKEFRFSDFQMSDTVEPPFDGFYELFFRPNDKSDSNFLIKFKPLTHRDDKIIKKYYSDKFATYETIFQIHSIDDNEDKKFIINFVERMPIKKFKSLKKTIDSMIPKIYEELTIECDSCGNVEKSAFKIDDGILKLGAEYRKGYENEMFLLQYYGQGGYNRESIFNMSVNQRRVAIERINEEVEKKNKAEQEAINKSKQKKTRV